MVYMLLLVIDSSPLEQRVRRQIGMVRLYRCWMRLMMTRRGAGSLDSLTLIDSRYSASPSIHPCSRSLGHSLIYACSP